MSKSRPYPPAAIRSVTAPPQYAENEKNEGFSLGPSLRSSTVHLQRESPPKRKKVSKGWICVICTVVFIILAIALPVGLTSRFRKAPVYHKDPDYKLLLMVECHEPGLLYFDDESTLNSEGDAATMDIVFRPYSNIEYSNGTNETLHCHMKSLSNPRLIYWAAKYMKKTTSYNSTRS